MRWEGVPCRAALIVHLRALDEVVNLLRGGWRPERTLTFEAGEDAGGWWAEAVADLPPGADARLLHAALPTTLRRLTEREP